MMIATSRPFIYINCTWKKYLPLGIRSLSTGPDPLHHFSDKNVKRTSPLHHFSTPNMSELKLNSNSTTATTTAAATTTTTPSITKTNSKNPLFSWRSWAFGFLFGFLNIIPYNLFLDKEEILLDENLQEAQDLAETDAETAIQIYLDWLDENYDANDGCMDFTYTHVVLSLAKIYEENNMKDKALAIYKELSHAYLHYLTVRHSGYISEKLFDRQLAVSLTIVQRYAQLTSEENIDDARELLLCNIILAQMRLVNNYPSFLSLFNDINNRNVLALLTLNENLTDPNETIELPLYSIPETPISKILGLARIWPTFTPALIQARDLYATITPDISELVANLVANTNVIQRSGTDLASLALTLSKLGMSLNRARGELEIGWPDDAFVLVQNDESETGEEVSITGDVKEYVMSTTEKEAIRVFKKTVELCDKLRLGIHGKESEVELVKGVLDRSEMVACAGLALLEDDTQWMQRARVLAVKRKEPDWVKDIDSWLQRQN
ncbi:hypothetical protein DAMA08_016190 [Martiniozyma asiatica (nom. inval.)]|nr:hypothetical protein DAMA08_016190 [Martiniozyma asiatica]